MKTKLTPLAKGLITGALMIIAFLVPYFTGQFENKIFTYIIWIIFAGGIIWSLVEFHYSPEYKAKFGSYFKEGFRCFIVAVLMLVLTMWIFFASNTKYREQDSLRVRDQLSTEKTSTGQPKYLPKEIDTQVLAYKKYYLLSLVSVYIFGYLILGSVITASGSVILLSRKK